MSLLTVIRQVLGIHSTPGENHFWDGSVANKLSLKRGVPGTPGTEIITVDAGLVTKILSKYVPRAVGVFSAAGAIVVAAGFSGSSKVSTGIFDLTFSEDMGDTNYMVQVTCDAGTVGVIGTVYGAGCTSAKVQVRIYNKDLTLTDSQFNVAVWKL